MITSNGKGSESSARVVRRLMNLKEAMIGWNKVESIRSNQSTGEVKEDEKVNAGKKFVVCRLRKSRNGWASELYMHVEGALTRSPRSSFSDRLLASFKMGQKRTITCVRL